MEQPAADLVLLEHDGDRLFLVDGSLTGAAAFSVGSEGLLELVGQAEIVDDEAAGLVPEHAIDPGDGLHKPVAAHRLIDVHGVKAGGVETGEPHIAHQHDSQGIVGVAEPVGQGLAPGLVPEMLALPIGQGQRRSRSSRP